MPGPTRWRVRLSAAAEADFQDILRWTAERFGSTQARTYKATLAAAIAALHDGPEPLGARERPDIAAGLFALHASSAGRRARHLILYRVKAPDIDVLRILHDAMDLPRHIPKD